MLNGAILISKHICVSRCVCNIDCSGYSFNPVCASDGSSYNNPCFVREASCLRQEQIDIRHLGHCSESDDTGSLGKKDEGLQYRPDVKGIVSCRAVPCSQQRQRCQDTSVIHAVSCPPAEW
ncbi:UNVERIFIED_CONTAM: hypothetical protein K2H54_004863 [Gekko kuhli]